MVKLKRNNSTLVLVQPRKSENDKNLYRTIKLHNGLTAILAHEVKNETSEGQYNGDFEDGKVPKCTISISVGVGGFDDPLKYQGMAHLLEHMLFMGTENFPEEDSLDVFIKKSGGDQNASTDGDVTNYYFEDLIAEALENALERLAEMFSKPLLKKDSLKREREAVESEYQGILESNAQIKRHILSSLARENHPARKFLFGNLLSLGAGPDVATSDQDAVDTDVHSEMIKFFKKHYVPESMTLAVKSSQHDLDTQQRLVELYFNQIPASNITVVKPKDTDPSLEAPFDTDKFKKLYYAAPVEETKEVMLTWALPPMMKDYRTKPYLYLGKVLSRKGPGSIFDYLNKRNWATELTAEAQTKFGIYSNNYYLIFSITVTLSEVGMDHLKEVNLAIFSYLQLLQEQGPSKVYFDEIQIIEDTNYRYSEDVFKPEEISVNMHKFPPEHYIDGAKLLFEYNRTGIMDFLGHLRHDNVNVMVLNSEYDKKYTEKDYWLNAPYNVESIPEDWTTSWQNATPLESFSLPTEPNPYIASNYEIFKLKSNSSDINQLKQISHDSESDLWYKRESKLPKAALYINLLSAAIIFMSPLNACMLDLVSNGWQKTNGALVALAGEAGLTTSISSSKNGIFIKIDGYNEKIPLLLENVLESWNTFERELDENMLGAIKNKTKHDYYNNIVNPSDLSYELEKSLLDPDSFTSIEKYNEIDDVTLEQLRSFSKGLKKAVLSKILVKGNMREEDAIQLKTKLHEILGSKRLTSGTSSMRRLAQLPVGETYLTVQAVKRDSPNSLYTKNFYCGMESIRDDCMADLIVANLSVAAFDYLRTKNQLGYSVNVGKIVMNGVLSLYINVENQEDKNPIGVVDNHFDIFITKFFNDLRNMTNETFQELKKTVKSAAADNFDEWEEVKRRGEQLMNRTNVVLETVDTLTLNETIDWFEKCVASKTHSRILTIAVQGYVSQNATHTGTEEKCGGEGMCLRIIKPPRTVVRKYDAVKSIDGFRKSLYYYPQCTKCGNMLD